MPSSSSGPLSRPRGQFASWFTSPEPQEKTSPFVAQARLKDPPAVTVLMARSANASFAIARGFFTCDSFTPVPVRSARPQDQTRPSAVSATMLSPTAYLDHSLPVERLHLLEG